MRYRWNPRDESRDLVIGRAGDRIRVLAAFFALCGSAGAACVPFTEAKNKIGESVCVTGTVLKVAEGRNGAWFLDFCEDYRKCPFTAVVFARDLRDVGDVRQLAGRTIELFGKVKLYDGRAEIILRDARQLRGEAAKLPPLPKTFDASRRGSYSAGRYRVRESKSSQKPAPKPAPAQSADVERER